MALPPLLGLLPHPGPVPPYQQDVPIRVAPLMPPPALHLLPPVPPHPDVQQQQIPFIDSHCHLDRLFNLTHYRGTFSQFKLENNVPENFGCVANFCDPGDEWWGLHEALIEENGVWGTYGLHPKKAGIWSQKIERQLMKAAGHAKCVAWGEMGLDYFQNQSPAVREEQRRVFMRLIGIGLSLGKPFVIHARGATEEAFNILKRTTPRGHKIHFHCFMGDTELVERMLGHFPNLYIGFTGLVTYDQNKALQSVVRACPINRILVETDAPYMKPFNCSWPCHPGMGINIVAKIAQLRGVTLNIMLHKLRDNVKGMYSV